MLKSVRKFLSDITKSGGDDTDELGDERLAAAALLVHITGIDGRVSLDEGSKLLELLQARFELTHAETEKLIAEAQKADHEAVDLYGFTSVLTSRLDESGRERIVEMMWEIVFADGELHEFEDNLVWRVAELIGVSSRDRLRLKKAARRRADEATAS